MDVEILIVGRPKVIRQQRRMKDMGVCIQASSGGREIDESVGAPWHSRLMKSPVNSKVGSAMIVGR